MYSTLTKSWLSNTIVFIVLVAFSINAAAQIEQTARFEVPLFNDDGNFEIIPAGNDGLFLNRRVNSSKGDQIQLIMLDTTFQQKWGGLLPVDNNYMMMGKRTFQQRLYLLLRFKDYSRNDLVLYVINNADGTYSRFNIKSFIPFTPSEFQVTDKAVIIGGYYNRVPVVLHFSLVTLKSKVLPGLFNESGELTQIKTYDDATFDVLISARNFEKINTIWIKNYDADGNLFRNSSLETEYNKHLIFGRSVKTDNAVQLVAGVYGTRSSEFSRGIFITSVDLSGLQQTRYYNFGDLENFFKYMKAKREKRVKDRIERRKIKGKKIKFNYRFLVHEIVPYKNQYILLGEAFYPKYTNIDRTSYGGFFTNYGRGGSMIQNGRIFEGYYYTHAVVMCFDQNGKLLWDNSFEINDVKTFTLEQFVKLEVKDDRIALLYLYENNIRSKIIKDNEVLEGKSVDPISTGRKDEIVRKDSDDLNKLEYWYDDHLYAYGVQEVLTKLPTGTARRKVFFINKLTYSQ